jgi:hypothetical protein
MEMNDKNHIENQEDNLKAIAPQLFKHRNGKPFKAGDDYFESFSISLQNEISDYEELKEESPILANLPKYSPFEVPANYFDEFATSIQQTIINKKTKTSIFEWLVLLIKPRFAVPVLATLLIAIAGINFMDKESEKLYPSLADEPTVEEQLLNIDEMSLIESLPVKENYETINDDNEKIKNYLIENNIDEVSLHEEL